MKKAVCIMSGGMDSTLCATLALKEGYEVVALHFDYDQRTMKREKRAFSEICDFLGIKNRLNLDVNFIAKIGANALTDRTLDIPKDGLGDEVPKTYVPFRNGIFISIAAALAEKEGANALFIGVVEDDSSGYPDCRSDFIKAIERAINLGTKDETKLEIKMPLVGLSKAQIVAKSLEFNSPLHLTWSCYESDDEACGLCDSCRLRLRGFELAKAKDPIKYAKNG
ncbi:7-cyano-7-deazaguanine synthase QueC [Campylobacter mucosalis]|uniref:7-cyano-7-deazaguanine synthase QueC n=1 Tax=Campylobacter mucosalis TaxID=202 RepID=UPI0004D9D7EC|nr:7-cyano-7-deazaguanine synthase QueC [Campylobacter mucosalis]KEA46249.1 7-cyano-7-deazaguanine synthase [Campylobacter mucosalis]QKF62709.1 7-cyano-7-deazaguanine synthase [Campylobacter mucosalis]